MFIGFINLANIITLGGLCSSLLAILCAANHYFCPALTFFLLAGVCDMMDGTAARRQQGRTNRSKIYGVQLDSLCDMVSFGVTPCMIAWFLGYNSPLDVIIYLLFVVCSATRLAYFNTLAMEKEDFSSKSFVGMPIPFSCFSTALLMLMLSFGLAPAGMAWAFRAVYIVVAVLYVLRINIPKPSFKVAIAFGALIGAVYLLTMFQWAGNSITESVENFIKSAS